MFTQMQLDQLQKLFTDNTQVMKKIVREEIEVEVGQVRHDISFQLIGFSQQIKDMKNVQKDLVVGIKRLEKGLEELQTAQIELKVTVDGHTKALTYIKKKLNKLAKDVDVIGSSYNKEIVDNRNRIIRLEDVVGVNQSKH